MRSRTMKYLRLIYLIVLIGIGLSSCSETPRQNVSESGIAGGKDSATVEHPADPGLAILPPTLENLTDSLRQLSCEGSVFTRLQKGSFENFHLYKLVAKVNASSRRDAVRYRNMELGNVDSIQSLTMRCKGVFGYMHVDRIFFDDEGGPAEFRAWMRELRIKDRHRYKFEYLMLYGWEKGSELYLLRLIAAAQLYEGKPELLVEMPRIFDLPDSGFVEYRYRVLVEE